MRLPRHLLHSLLALAGSAFGAHTATAGTRPAAASAEGLLRAGRFSEAERLLAEQLERQPQDVATRVGLGHLALLRNGLAEAERHLLAALELKPKLKQAQALLGEAYYRRDELERAAPLFEKSGQAAKARQLASFADRRPYEIHGPTRATQLPFVKTDPLPIVSLRVNGREPAHFLIDTGGGELILGAPLALQVGALRFGGERSTFAGGREAGLEFGRVDSVVLGELEIRNVPVVVMDLANVGAALGEPRIDGIIGTVLLYHFLSTIDYAGGRLILQPRETAPAPPPTDSSGDGVDVPFWLAADHFMVAWGAVNDGPELLFFVDTGLAGAGFTCPPSTLDAAALRLRRDGAGKGVGVGGAIETVPFVVDELRLGPWRRPQIDGLAGPFPPQLEWGLGFHIGGLISHQFFRGGALTLDFAAMRLRLRAR